MKNLTDLAAERALLGTLFSLSAIDAESARAGAEGCAIAAADFAATEHGETFGAALELLRRAQAPEPVGLWSLLRPSVAVAKAGGMRWLESLHAEAPAIAGESHFRGYARTVADLATRRRVVETARQIAGKALNLSAEVSGVLTEGSEAWRALATRQGGLGTSEQDVFRVGEMLDAVQRGVRVPVVKTGVELLDDLISGLQPTLTIVGALPAVGKSALLATVMRNLGLRGVKTGFFSLEDERTWLTYRLLAMEAAVPVPVLQFKPLYAEQMKRVDDAGSVVYDIMRQVVIDDRIGLTPADVVQTARDMVLNHGCKVILLDHLGELRYGGNRERFDLDVGDALRELRSIAKQYAVPVVVACHLRRRDGLGIENEPRLTDFANSSAIERMARVALGLSKPDGHTLRVTVLKQTNGVANASVDLRFVGPAGMVESKSDRAAATTDADDEKMLLGRRGAA